MASKDLTFTLAKFPGKNTGEAGFCQSHMGSQFLPTGIPPYFAWDPGWDLYKRLLFLFSYWNPKKGNLSLACPWVSQPCLSTSLHCQLMNLSSTEMISIIYLKSKVVSQKHSILAFKPLRYLLLYIFSCLITLVVFSII